MSRPIAKTEGIDPIILSRRARHRETAAKLRIRKAEAHQLAIEWKQKFSMQAWNEAYAEASDNFPELDKTEWIDMANKAVPPPDAA